MRNTTRNWFKSNIRHGCFGVAFVFLACSMDDEGGNSETSAGLLAGEKADVEQDATSFFVTDDNDGRGQVFGHTPRWAFTRTSDGDLERLRELAETGPRSDSPSRLSPVADAIATLRGLDPSQEISVTFELSENGIPPLRPLPPGASAREAAIAGRARSLAPIQDALVARARARGGSEVGRSWLANLVTLRLSSVAAASLAESADVLGVSAGRDGMGLHQRVQSHAKLGSSVQLGAVLRGRRLRRCTENHHRGDQCRHGRGDPRRLQLEHDQACSVARFRDLGAPATAKSDSGFHGEHHHRLLGGLLPLQSERVDLPLSNCRAHARALAAMSHQRSRWRRKARRRRP